MFYICTYRHLDHTGGIPSLLAHFGEDIPVYQFPFPADQVTEDAEVVSYSHPSSSSSTSSTTLSDSKHNTNSTTGDTNGDIPFDTTDSTIDTTSKTGPLTRAITDNMKFSTEGASLIALHTPGHTADHVAFFLEEEKAIFSGDCILGQGTTLFADLYTYMASLTRLKEMEPRLIYPAHGPVVDSAVDWIEHYIDHRHTRETQILQVLQDTYENSKNDINSTNGLTNSGLTIMELVRLIYTTTPEKLYLAASRNVQLHLGKLLKEGKVTVREHKSDPTMERDNHIEEEEESEGSGQKEFYYFEQMKYTYLPQTSEAHSHSAQTVTSATHGQTRSKV